MVIPTIWLFSACYLYNTDLTHLFISVDESFDRIPITCNSNNGIRMGDRPSSAQNGLAEHPIHDTETPRRPPNALRQFRIVPHPYHRPSDRSPTACCGSSSRGSRKGASARPNAPIDDSSCTHVTSTSCDSPSDLYGVCAHDGVNRVTDDVRGSNQTSAQAVATRPTNVLISEEDTEREGTYFLTPTPMGYVVGVCTALSPLLSRVHHKIMRVITVDSKNGNHRWPIILRT